MANEKHRLKVLVSIAHAAGFRRGCDGPGLIDPPYQNPYKIYGNPDMRIAWQKGFNAARRLTS